MRDPGPEQLEWALAHRCDDLLSDSLLPSVMGGKVRSVGWLYGGREYRALLFLPPDAARSTIAPLEYARWRVGHQPFDALPSRPVFEWRWPGSPWRTATTAGEWRRALALADPDEPDNLSGRPVRPRRSPPTLSAAAELPIEARDEAPR